MHRLLALLFLTLSGLALNGQGAHYWTRQYGARSTLLSNSVIGSVNDLGAVFYNPGRLGLIEDPSFILSADVYEYSLVGFKDLPGDQVSITTSDLGSVPGFIAGTFKFKSLPRHKFAYSMLTRQRNDVNIRYRETFTGDFVQDIPGDEEWSSTTLLNERLRQQWYSISWSYELSDDWGVGATLAGVRYKSGKLIGIGLQVFADQPDLVSYTYDRFFEFSTYGALLKIGLAKRNERINWGLTLTTPMANLFGSGEYDFEEVYDPYQDLGEPLFTSVQQLGLDVKFKLPWSVGAGIGIRTNKAQIYFSSEWFAAIKKYTILETDEFIGQSSGDTVSFRVFDDLKSVINFGIGLEYQFKENLGLYLSASTDFSAVKDETDFVSINNETANSAFGSNLYHIASGVVFDIAHSDITLGLTYTGASEQIRRATDIPEDGNPPLLDLDNSAKFQWTRIQVVLGFSLSFLQK